MKRIRLWYTLSFNTKKRSWTVWMNKEYFGKESGGFGSLGIYSSQKKQDCIDYCKKAGIKLEKEKIRKNFARRQ